MDINTFLQSWLVTSNTFDTEAYVKYYDESAVIDDPSAGEKFRGHSGIRKYFEDYFVGYNTQTKIIKIDIVDKESAHLEAFFSGNFSERGIGGTLDFTFHKDKIIHLKADLL